MRIDRGKRETKRDWMWDVMPVRNRYRHTWREEGCYVAAFECPGFFATVTVPISVLTSEEPPPPSDRYLRKVIR